MNEFWKKIFWKIFLEIIFWRNFQKLFFRRVFNKYFFVEFYKNKLLKILSQGTFLKSILEMIFWRDSVTELHLKLTLFPATNYNNFQNTSNNSSKIVLNHTLQLPPIHLNQLHSNHQMHSITSRYNAKISTKN